MSMNTSTPGFYLDPEVAQAADPEELRTAVPLFMGYVERLGRGQLGQPVSVERYADFVRYFCHDSQLDLGGGRPGLGGGPYLRRSLYLYFLNGGGPCHVLPVGMLDGQTSPQASDFEDHWAEVERVEEITLVVPTDAVLLPLEDYLQVCRATLAYCSSSGRFALLDPPLAEGPGAGAVMAGLRAFALGLGRQHLAYGAAYFPYLNLRPNGSDAEDLLALPSAAAAAAIHVTDLQRGIWKAPANVALEGVLGLSTVLRKEDMEAIFAPAEGGSLNLMRSLHGRGIYVWGARTLAGQDHDWRYLNVRRLVSFVEQQLRRRTQFSVFEPNTMRTWIILKGVCESFLDELWEAGGLKGERRDAAFKVEVGLGSSMSQADIDAGRLVVQLRLAVRRPAEFITLQLYHRVQAVAGA